MNNYKIIPLVDVSKVHSNKHGLLDRSHVAEDHIWTFDNRDMDFTKDLGLKGKYCYHPFNTITVDKFGDVYLCICQAWLPISVGKIWEFDSFEDIVTSPKALEIQSSIIDGSYRYCDHLNCSIIKENELSGKVEHKYHTVNWVNFAVDNSCNLTCPSCRKEFLFESEGTEFDLKIKIIDHLKKLIEQHPQYLKFTLSGDGDPFASLVYRHFLTTLDLDKSLYYDIHGNLLDPVLFDDAKVKDKKLIALRKNLSLSELTEFIDLANSFGTWSDLGDINGPNRTIEIEIVTNGILLKDHWHKLEKIHKNIIRTKISFDAGSEPVYDIVRTGGSWKKLVESSKFLSKWKQKTYSDMQLTANFVVQTANYKDMPAYVDLCDRLGFDEINFQKITDWGTFSNFSKEAVWMETHPEYKEFLNILRSLNNSKINYTNLTDLRHETK